MTTISPRRTVHLCHNIRFHMLILVHKRPFWHLLTRWPFLCTGSNEHQSRHTVLCRSASATRQLGIGFSILFPLGSWKDGVWTLWIHDGVQTTQAGHTESCFTAQTCTISSAFWVYQWEVFASGGHAWAVDTVLPDTVTCIRIGQLDSPIGKWWPLCTICACWGLGQAILLRFCWQRWWNASWWLMGLQQLVGILDPCWFAHSSCCTQSTCCSDRPSRWFVDSWRTRRSNFLPGFVETVSEHMDPRLK